MFHVMLVLPVFFILGFIVSIFLFSIFTIIAGLIGGTSTAVYIKNKEVKRLVFIGFSILTFIGLSCLLPLIIMYAQLPELVFTTVTVAAVACIGILAVMGIRYAGKLQNKIVKAVLIAVFGLILTFALAVIVFILIIRGMLLSA